MKDNNKMQKNTRTITRGLPESGVISRRQFPTGLTYNEIIK